MATSAPKEDPVAHSVAVQLPTFNRLAPSAWFHLADANFHLRGIVKNETKYWYVVSKLDPDTLQKLSAFLAKKRGEDPYAEVRALLCQTYEPKMEQMLNTLLAVKDLGDERPSEYALELRRLLGNATLDDILKRLFVRSMPKNIANAISSHNDDSFDSLARAADKAWALSSAAGASVNAVSESKTSLGNRNRAGRQQPGKSGGKDCKNITLCRFHVKWGDAAKRCLPACSRWEQKYQQWLQQVFQVEELDAEENPASEN